MKNKMHRLETLSFYDHTGIEKHLTKMAQKGWMIEHITNQFWTYRKIEPQEYQFAVTYYPKATDFDPEPSIKHVRQVTCEDIFFCSSLAQLAHSFSFPG